MLDTSVRLASSLRSHTLGTVTPCWQVVIQEVPAPLFQGLSFAWDVVLVEEDVQRNHCWRHPPSLVVALNQVGLHLVISKKKHWVVHGLEVDAMERVCNPLASHAG